MVIRSPAAACLSLWVTRAGLELLRQGTHIANVGVSRNALVDGTGWRFYRWRSPQEFRDFVALVGLTDAELEAA
jgi:hypothetical protein